MGEGFSGPNGTFNVNVAPPDTGGAVGRTQYVQLVNTSIMVFDKQTLTKLSGPTATNSLFSSLASNNPCRTTNDGDGIVLYDHLADRWIITQFGNASPTPATGPYYECVAVSQTSDATGSYFLYFFSYSQFPDYPKIGIWPDAYYMSYNVFTSPTGSFVGGKVCALDRANMLTGAATRGAPGPAGTPSSNPPNAPAGNNQVCFNITDSGLLPADLDGAAPPSAGSPNYFLEWFDNSDLGLWKFHVDWTTLTNSTLNGVNWVSPNGPSPNSISAGLIAVTAFTATCDPKPGNGFNTVCIPQKGTGQLLDSLSDRVMHRLAYRNFGTHESLVVNHAVVAGTSSGIRWYEIQNPNGTPTVPQTGTWAPDSSWRWMGSMAMDQQGNIAVGYSVSSSSLFFPSIAYATRLAGDPLGTLGTETTLMSGAGSQTGGLDRWGDYSAMSVDPVDDCTFWYTNEYLAASGSFNWHTRIASFKFPSCSSQPANVSASPLGGFGNAQTFTFVYSDTGGASQITIAQAIFNTALSTIGGCALVYNNANNTITMYDDGGFNLLTPIPLGQAGTLSNSRCSLNAGSSSSTPSGNNLTLQLALTFTPAFAGQQFVLMNVSDSGGKSAGWQNMGTWNTGSGAFQPANVSASPLGGSGNTQTFTFAYSDTGGASQITIAQAIFNTALSTVGACALVYNNANNTISMYDDGGYNLLTPIPLGQAGTLSNSRCSLNAGSSSSTPSGNNLTLQLALTFTPAFAGQQSILMNVSDSGGKSAGWQNMGTWNTGSGATQPSNVSVTPNSGNGTSNAFSFVYSDTGGASQITIAQAIFNTALTTVGACALVYNNANNTISMYDDGGFNLLTPIPLGQAGTLSNSRCSLNAGSSSSTPSGNNLTLQLALTFTPAFTGQQSVLMNVSDSGGKSAGWQNLGTWNTGSGATQPSNVSVTPNSGNGTSQTFSFLYSDTGGASAITVAQAILNSGLTTTGGCALVYYNSNNTISLYKDDGNTLLTPIPIGQAGTLSNSQCTVNAGTSSATPSGNNLTLSLALTFTGAFAGQQAIFMNVTDSGGKSAGWQNKGTWNTGSGATQPSNVSVTPNSGSGSSQTFSFVYSDTGGASAITNAQAIVNGALTTISGCALIYNNSNNTITMYNDSGFNLLAPIPLGQAGTLSNSQCTLNAGTSSATPSGNNLTVNLALTFTPGFAGSKHLFANVSDTGGKSAGWSNLGLWTVP
ncbi:MAG: hypothetical protein LAN37_10320 [Acidobacteriia bacterium]|nr:hypothetical protein [Terriglobia bacterium]